jgi:hypothetical protein
LSTAHLRQRYGRTLKHDVDLASEQVLHRRSAACR